jgi:hypothetical protein
MGESIKCQSSQKWHLFKWIGVWHATVRRNVLYGLLMRFSAWAGRHPQIKQRWGNNLSPSMGLRSINWLTVPYVTVNQKLVPPSFSKFPDLYRNLGELKAALELLLILIVKVH